MDAKHWNAILSRIGPHDADDLDALLAPFDPRHAAMPGRDIFPLPEAMLMPQVELKREDAVCIGLRAPAADAAPASSPCSSGACASCPSASAPAIREMVVAIYWFSPPAAPAPAAARPSPRQRRPAPGRSGS